jgi:hypothetical protein
MGKLKKFTVEEDLLEKDVKLQKLNLVENMDEIEAN